MQRLILFFMLFMHGVLAYASDRYLINFELLHGEKKIDWGRSVVQKKTFTWSNGMKRSYLKLDCEAADDMAVKKIYSTVDYFSGLKVTHMLEGDKLKLVVTRNTVRARYHEIRSLEKNQCKNLSPILDSVTETYHLPARADASFSQAFGEDMIFKASLVQIGGTR